MNAVGVSTSYLAAIPSPPQGVWYIGPIPLRAYALCILTGVFIAVWLADRRYRERGGDQDVALDVAILAVPVGIVGARLYHVITSPEAYFGPDGDLALIPQVWHGGLGIWGGVAAGVAAGAWLLHHRGLRLAPMADAVAPALLIAQAVGRVEDPADDGVPGLVGDLLRPDRVVLRAHGVHDAGQRHLVVVVRDDHAYFRPAECHASSHKSATSAQP